jgi:DNA-binding Xre family transcriptional regulator
METERRRINVSFNVELFNTRLNQSGIKKKALAKKLGITPQGLKLKSDGVNEFKVSEISVLCDELRLSSDDRDLIFFAKM